jgi:sulfur-carrier protein adenylyltransferase/sulfurtransferase
MLPSGIEFHISVYELRRRMEEGERILMLDVREPQEHETVNLGGLLIPLQELPRRLRELDRTRELVVYCHHGVRSMTAVNFLLANGFAKARNLAGGIDRWSLEIDSSVRRY